MGIKGLGKFIGDFAPRAIKRQEAASFASRVVAVDASMSLYQFLISIRDADSFGSFTNEAGECTSHIAGMLNRALRLLEQGIKPVYVFDGEPPALKAAELAKRRGTREAAATAAEAAREAGDTEELRKQLARSLRVEKKHAADVQRLLRLMGLPVVQAPGEAEAQCAELTKHQRVWATATEDADALTFGATRLIRNLTFGGSGADRNSSSSKAGGGGSSSSSAGSHQHGGTAAAVLLIDLPTLLQELRFTQEQFVDFCILCGCDYCGTVRGVGAKTAYAILRDHGSLERAIAAGALEQEKLPDPFPFEEVRQLFINPRVLPAAQVDITWSDIDADGLRKFLVQENQFNEQRVENCILRLKKARGKASQMRLESFFGAPTTKSSSLMQKQQQEKQKQLELQRQKKLLPKKSAKRSKRDAPLAADSGRAAAVASSSRVGAATAAARTAVAPAGKEEEKREAESEEAQEEKEEEDEEARRQEVGREPKRMKTESSSDVKTSGSLTAVAESSETAPGPPVAKEEKSDSEESEKKLSPDVGAAAHKDVAGEREEAHGADEAKQQQQQHTSDKRTATLAVKAGASADPINEKQQDTKDEKKQQQQI